MLAKYLPLKRIWSDDYDRANIIYTFHTYGANFNLPSQTLTS